MAAGPGRVCSSGCACFPPPRCHRPMARWDDIIISSSLFSAGGLWVGCAPPCTWEAGEQVMSLLLSASPEGAFRRLMGLGVFKRHVALPKSGFGVRQVPWAALSQLLAVSGVQHRG